MLFARCFKKGFICSNSSGLPPAMMLSVPVSAAVTLPLTPASIIPIPLLANREAIQIVWFGLPLVRSMTFVPFLVPEPIPSTPRATSATICELGNDRKILLHCEAKPLGGLATAAPFF